MQMSCCFLTHTYLLFFIHFWVMNWQLSGWVRGVSASFLLLHWTMFLFFASLSATTQTKAEQPPQQQQQLQKNRWCVFWHTQDVTENSGGQRARRLLSDQNSWRTAGDMITQTSGRLLPAASGEAITALLGRGWITQHFEIKPPNPQMNASGR